MATVTMFNILVSFTPLVHLAGFGHPKINFGHHWVNSSTGWELLVKWSLNLGKILIVSNDPLVDSAHLF